MSDRSLLDDTAREEGDYAEQVSIPDWIYNLRPLLALTGVVGTLEAIGENPTDFIMEVVLGTVVDWIFEATTIVIDAIQLSLSPLVSVPETIAEPLIAGGATIATALASVIGTVNDTIVTLSTAAGPAAPLVVVVVWGVIFVLAAEMIRSALRSVPLVVPWL